MKQISAQIPLLYLYIIYKHMNLHKRSQSNNDSILHIGCSATGVKELLAC